MRRGVRLGRAGPGASVADLYLVEPGTVAHKVGERVVVKRDERVLDDIPLVKI